MNISVESQNSHPSEFQIKIVEDSFAWIAPQGRDFAAQFYNHLFTTHPEVVRLFDHLDLEEQQNKFLAALTIIVHKLRHPDHLSHFLEELGQRHVAYGVTVAHYDAVIETLLLVLAQFAKETWSPEICEAWQTVLKTSKTIMLNGRQQVVTDGANKSSMRDYRWGQSDR